MGRTVMESGNIQVDFSTLDNIKSFTPVYHEDEDTFFLRPAEPRLATSFDWNGEVWIRVDPQNGEIVGLEIDDFEAIFLKRYPQIANAWKESKPLCRGKGLLRHKEVSWEAFLRIILEFLLAFFRDRPQQASFAPA